MELFPAANEDQWTLIKEVIDDSDYYIVIIGGRYGSTGPEGLSYTEMEYRYAIETGKPTLGFLHGNPDDLPAAQTETDPEKRLKLQGFRNLLRTKMCRFWSTGPELGGLVSRSLIRLIKRSPAIGWIRADQVPSSQVMREVLEMQRRLEAAEKRAKEAVAGATAAGLENVGLEGALGRQKDFGSDTDWLEFIDEAVERVDLMGRALYGWTRSSEVADLIKRKISEDRVRFRWLVMAPENRFLPLLEEKQVYIGSALREKLEVLTRFLRDIQEGLPEEQRELLEVRTFRNVPLYFGYIRVDDRFLITHYMSTASSPSSPMLLLSSVGAAWPRAYSREFETIWTLSKIKASEQEPAEDC